MAAKRKFSEEQLAEILSDFHSDMGGTEIGKKHLCDYSRTIRPIWVDYFSEDKLKKRIKRLCKTNQLGSFNTMFGRKGNSHHRHKDSYVSTQGYILVDAPTWYTGPLKGTKAPQHIIVACKTSNISELPVGYIVHHKDENKFNNDPSNLEIMTRSNHMKEHCILNHQKKVQRLS